MYEEIRAFSHFQILCMVSSMESLGKEKVLFQRFLRDNQFELSANGINPPPHLFSAQSYATVDLRLMAHFVGGLNGEKKQRFHALKLRYSEQLALKEKQQAIEDTKQVLFVLFAN